MNEKPKILLYRYPKTDPYVEHITYDPLHAQMIRHLFPDGIYETRNGYILQVDISDLKTMAELHGWEVVIEGRL